MWSKIGQVLLKNGRIMEVRRVVAPDHYHESRIKSLLPQYGALWMWHLNLALSGRLDDLDACFYVGVLDGKLIGNVSTCECGPIGIVGHLFTAKKHREEGVCTALMGIAVKDFSSRGGKILIGGFRPASRRIATKLGFKSLTPKSEVMHLELDQRFEQNYFHVGKLWCRDLKWRDWPGVSLLFGVEEGWRIRSMKHRIFGPYDYEDYFLEDMWGMRQGVCQPKVLVAKNGSVIGYAALTLKDNKRCSFWLLDFFVHPSKVSDVGILLNALTFPPGKVRCYVERGCCEKFDALLNRGFAEKTRRRFKFRGKTLNIIVMER
jgi:hypothetical protein